jgi:tripartite-type tricarboxylate transporter receptor subunit TctC
MNIRKASILALAAVMAPGLSLGAARADDLFAGKTISLLASSAPGGGYDSYTRLLARFIGKYIPGKPTVVVQNMPGGGGLRVAQYIYSVAEKDGTKIGNLRGSNMLDSILNIRGGDIDPRKYEWLGNMASDTDICSFWHTAGVHSFADLQNKETLIGGSGKGAQNYSFPSAINHVLGTKMKIILGYQGMGDRIIAMQHGELQGNCGMNASSLTSLQPQLLSSGQLIPIMQSGTHPYPALKDVPLTQSFAKTDKQRKILTTIFSQMDIARTFATPPGTPRDRVEALRTAFMQALKDPDLIAQAKKEKLDLDPMGGDEVAKVIADMADIDAALKQEVRTAIGS